MKYIVICSMLLTTVAWSAQKKESFSAVGIKSIDVQCVNGKFHFIGNSDKKELNLITRVYTKTGFMGSSSGWNVEAVKQMDKLIVKCEFPSSDLSKINKKAVEKNQLPVFEVIVTGPAKPLNLNWKYGAGTIKNWSANSVLTLEDLDLTVTESKAEFQVYNLNGPIQVDGYEGRLTVEGYKSKVLLKNIKGNVSVKNFLGLTRMTALNGDVKFSAHKSKVRVDDSEGTFKFQNDLGQVDIQNFKGPVSGEMEQGEFLVRATDDPQIRLKSKAVNAQIWVPRGSAPYVSLTTSSDGKLIVPSYVKTKFWSNMKTASGRLKGRSQKGRIAVKTESGKISLKTY